MTMTPIAETDSREGCARLMATSEPWITLRRGYAASLAALTNPVKERYLVRDGNRPSRPGTRTSGDGLVGQLGRYVVDDHRELLLRKSIGSWDGFRSNAATAASPEGEG